MRFTVILRIEIETTTEIGAEWATAVAESIEEHAEEVAGEDGVKLVDDIEVRVVKNDSGS